MKCHKAMLSLDAVSMRTEAGSSGFTEQIRSRLIFYIL